VASQVVDALTGEGLLADEVSLKALFDEFVDHH
jgi:hypothetical protein